LMLKGRALPLKIKNEITSGISVVLGHVRSTSSDRDSVRGHLV
jgi:hypothetical protein